MADLAAFNPFSSTQASPFFSPPTSDANAFDARPPTGVFATSLHDFTNPGASATSPPSYFNNSTASLAQSHAVRYAPPRREQEAAAPKPSSLAVTSSSRTAQSSVTLSAFWAHPVSGCTCPFPTCCQRHESSPVVCHTAFKPATGGAPQNATTRMLLLVTKLHKNGILSAEAKGRVKVFIPTTPPLTLMLLASDARVPRIKCCVAPSPRQSCSVSMAALLRYASGFWRFLPPQKLISTFSTDADAHEQL